MGGRDRDRDRRRDRDETPQAPRGSESHELGQIRNELRQVRDELSSHDQRIAHVGRLAVQTASDFGHHRAALQVVLFLAGNVRTQCTGIVADYQDKREDVRSGRVGKGDPLKVLLYRHLVQSLHATAEAKCPQAREATQALVDTPSNLGLAAIGNSQKPTDSDPWIMVLTFAPSDEGRRLRQLWSNPLLLPLFAKKDRTWPDIGCKPGRFRPNNVLSNVAADLGMPLAPSRRSPKRTAGPAADQDGRYVRQKSENARRWSLSAHSVFSFGCRFLHTSPQCRWLAYLPLHSQPLDSSSLGYVPVLSGRIKWALVSSRLMVDSGLVRVYFFLQRFCFWFSVSRFSPRPSF